ncbi:hypothetical protein [Thermococcus sp.]|uniref:hypothetical protein n=1 Tax=Thermococcus sp. TaxID=35749 RepID=UPI0026136448|nr:hypothetical protein [Thermococcus sp.]
MGALKVVAVEEKGAVVALIMVLVFSALFILPVLYLTSTVPGAGMIALLFIAITSIFLIGGVYVALTRIRASGRVRDFTEKAIVSGNSVSFPMPLEYEAGRLNLAGYWTGSGRNRHYQVDRNFMAERSGTSQSIEFPEREFNVAIDADGSGIVTAPAVRILSDPYKDVLLMFLTDSGRVTGEGTIQLSHNGDSAEITFRGEGKSIVGRVQAYLSRARKVRVEISAPGAGRNVVGQGLNFEFMERMLPEEKTLIVTGYKTASPRSLMRHLEGTVMGHGDFILRAVLDIPLRPDVREERTFRVELSGKEEEEESREGWGF